MFSKNLDCITNYSGDTSRSIPSPGSTTPRESTEIIKEQLASHLNVLKDALLDTTKPAISKREKSDLHIWREIFSLYEHSAIICPNKECTCIIEEMDIIRSRYALFWSIIGSHQFVDLIPCFFGADWSLDKSISAVSKPSNLYSIQGSTDLHDRNFDDESEQRSNSAFDYRISCEPPSNEYRQIIYHIKLITPLTPQCRRGKRFGTMVMLRDKSDSYQNDTSHYGLQLSDMHDYYMETRSIYIAISTKVQ